MAGAAADAAVILSAVLAQIRKLTEEQAQSLMGGAGEFRYVPKTLSTHYTKLTKLSDEQLQQLATGEATYALVPKGYRVAKIPPPKPALPPKPARPSASEVRAALLAADDQTSAREYLVSLKLKAPEIRQLASDLDVPSSGTVKVITDALVKVFVTGRLTTAAVRF